MCGLRWNFVVLKFEKWPTMSLLQGLYKLNSFNVNAHSLCHIGPLCHDFRTSRNTYVYSPIKATCQTYKETERNKQSDRQTD